MDAAHLQTGQFAEPQTAHAGQEEGRAVALLGVRKKAGQVLR